MLLWDMLYFFLMKDICCWMLICQYCWHEQEKNKCIFCSGKKKKSDSTSTSLVDPSLWSVCVLCMHLLILFWISSNNATCSDQSGVQQWLSFISFMQISENSKEEYNFKCFSQNSKWRNMSWPEVLGLGKKLFLVISGIYEQNDMMT